MTGVPGPPAIRYDPIGVDPTVWSTVAGWCVEAWAADYPTDTVAGYLATFAAASSPAGDLTAPIVLLARCGFEPVGTASLLAEDGLNGWDGYDDLTAPGPWLAAVFVAPAWRGQGIGRALVAAIVDVARACGHRTLFLHTTHHAAWYARQGWVAERTVALRTHPSTVMRRTLTGPGGTG